GLKGQADREGKEPDGAVTVGELAAYLVEQVPLLARKNGKTSEEKGQYAGSLGDHAARTVLTRNPAVAARARQPVEKLKKLVAEHKLPDQLGAEGKRLFEQMPGLEWQRALRKLYQQLAEGVLT